MGISWDSLRDAWGHPYYAIFRQDAVYADKVNVESYENYLGRAEQHRELAPVTRQMNYVYIRSAGEDGIEGTSDDFYAATYSRASLERSGQGQSSVPFGDATIFSGASGAISGTVEDQSGGAIPHTEVTAIDSVTGYAFHATTDEFGVYLLQNVHAGIYERSGKPRERNGLS